MKRGENGIYKVKETMEWKKCKIMREKTASKLLHELKMKFII